MALKFDLNPAKLGQTLDWYWSLGIKRPAEHELGRGSWLDALYAIVRAHRESSGSRKTLAIWGPSQSGKSTLMASYLDANLRPSPMGQCSSALTWSDSDPVTFLHRGQGVTSLNPHNAGSDASGCVTRYTAADSVRFVSHPVRLRFNNLMHVMHALAFGYLSECLPATPDKAPVFWDRDRITKEFIKKHPSSSTIADRRAYELLRSILDILGMFVRSGEVRFAGLRPQWDSLRRELLESSALAQSEEAALHFASIVFWDGCPTLSGVFRSLRSKVESMGWSGREVYCTYAVAALLLDIDTFKRFSNPADESSSQEMSAKLQLVGWREEAGAVLIGFEGSTVGISGKEFGSFQALVREIVLPVKRDSVSRESPFFALLEEADVLDFPGVALKDSQGNSLNKLDLSELGERDPRLLTSVFKRGKTSSIVMGYGNDVSIDAFALLVRAKSFPSKPEQLCSGIRYWWEMVDPEFKPALNESGATPLPLSVCMTFFGMVLNEASQIKSKNLGPLFKDMLEPLAPFDRPANATYFATSYVDFKAAGEIKLSSSEREAVAADIRANSDFQRVFGSEESRTSFERLLSDKDGGVGYFLCRQLEKVRSSRKSEWLERLKKRDVERGLQLIEQAVPEVEDVGSRQKRMIADVEKIILANLRQWEVSVPPELRVFAQVEDATSLYSFWIRSLQSVEPDDLDPIPLDYAQMSKETRVGYVTRQWARWREGVLSRMRRIKGFNWGLLGLGDEAEARTLLRLMAEGRGLDIKLCAWVADEVGFLTSESPARVLRQELAVVMGNIIRHGQIEPPSVKAAVDLKAAMKRHVDWENDVGGLEDSPHYVRVIGPFLECVRALKTDVSQRPDLTGDAELRNIWTA